MLGLGLGLGLGLDAPPLVSRRRSSSFCRPSFVVISAMAGNQPSEPPPRASLAGATQARRVHGRFAPEPPSNLVTAIDDWDLRDRVDLAGRAKRALVVNFGAAWCHVCRGTLPRFERMAHSNPKMDFVVADVEECSDTAKNIRFTPTFAIFRGGKMVDRRFGGGDADLQAVEDRLWLHQDWPKFIE